MYRATKPNFLFTMTSLSSGRSGATGGVLVRDRIAEASQEALFAALHDGPIEPAHGPLADPLEHLQHFRLDFGIRDFQVPFGLEQLGRADQYLMESVCVPCKRRTQFEISILLHDGANI